MPGPERLIVGRVVKPHAGRGEVVVRVESDAPSRFAAGSRMDASFPDGSERSLTVASSRRHLERLLVLFREARGRDAAEALRGAVLTIPSSEAAPPPPGSYYPHDLEGCDVVSEDGERLGTLARVEFLPANDVWVVAAAGREILLPAIRDVVVSVDLEERRVVVRVLPGLLD